MNSFPQLNRVIFTILLSVTASYGAGLKKDSVNSSFKVPATLSRTMNSFCLDCHDSDLQKGDIRLDNLQNLKLNARLELLNKVQEQVFSGEMPPRKKKQPSEKERHLLLEWVSAELEKHQASKLQDKLRYYRYGNYISHEKLFSGRIKAKPFTPARRWKINEMIYFQRLNDITGWQSAKDYLGVIRPFTLPSHSGVTYYANDTVSLGEFMTLFKNAKWIVQKQLESALRKNGEYVSLVGGKVNSKKKVKEPRIAARSEFDKIILSKSFPSDSDLKAAIKRQFQLVLHRSPGADEMAFYLAFTKDAVKKGGNSMGLQKMMVAVLMEPDFLYRSEMGDGHPDSSGRMQLTPIEASYAISYALTDDVPDSQLIKAAQSGKLSSKKDYEREIRRILEDKRIQKPRLLRFFQDFFGYKKMYQIFKDELRFENRYNPARVVANKFKENVPGKITKEADLLIQWILERDKDVFKELLTTDRFFINHTGNNAEMKKKFESELSYRREVYRKVYIELKSSIKQKKNWMRKVNTAMIKKVLAKNKLKAVKGKGIFTTHILRDLRLLEQVFGVDGEKTPSSNPIPKVDDVPHANKMYNLDPEKWTYNQPMKIANRMGMLTHPAWLVSHSQNTHTDPVIRGKWIREKLLAGFIQDVPITVDAKVPEDPHKTLRERFSVTEKEECWNCHRKMNPVGYVFESFDDFGRFRIQETLEHPESIISYKVLNPHRKQPGPFNRKKVPIYKTKAVNPAGYLEGTGSPKLDGKVKDANDLVRRLAQSDRVRQSIIRNVFRYFMGRNEMLSDSQTLIDADRAYLNSGGSFKALVVSLLTSDSFMYRKNIR